MKPKPSHLGIAYGSQFGDASVAEAYAYRLPYAHAALALVGGLQPHGPGRALDLGCGTGDATIGLLDYVSHVDAVDPSRPMLAVARKRPGADDARIAWHESSAEAFEYATYSVAVAAESLHWMEWDIVMPKIAGALAPGAHLAIMGRHRILPSAIRKGLNGLIPQFSTNQAYRPYDIVVELASRDLFKQVGREEFVSPPIAQSISSFVESFHSQNGLSRQRMSPEAAIAFDDAVDRLVKAHGADTAIGVGCRTTVIWGEAKAG